MTIYRLLDEVYPSRQHYFIEKISQLHTHFYFAFHILITPYVYKQRVRWGERGGGRGGERGKGIHPYTYKFEKFNHIQMKAID